MQRSNCCLANLSLIPGLGARPPVVSQAHHDGQRKPSVLPRRSVMRPLRSVRILSLHLKLSLGQQAFLMVLIVAPQHETDDERHSEQGPACRPGDAMYAGAKQIAAQSED